MGRGEHKIRTAHQPIYLNPLRVHRTG